MSTITAWPPRSWSRYPGYLPGSEFSIFLPIAAAPGTTQFQAAAPSGIQWAVTAVKFRFKSTATAYSTTVGLSNAAAPTNANLKWTDIVGLPAAIAVGGDGVVFPSEEPILMGSGNGIWIYVDQAFVAGVSAIAVVKGYQVSV